MTNALQQLVTLHCEDTGETLADIARRGHMSRQTVSAIMHRNGESGIPRRATLKKLANGLGVPVDTVAHAASVAAAGTQVAPTEQRLDVLLAYASTMSEQRLQALLAMARTLAGVK